MSVPYSATSPFLCRSRLAVTHLHRCFVMQAIKDHGVSSLARAVVQQSTIEFLSHAGKIGVSYHNWEMKGKWFVKDVGVATGGMAPMRGGGGTNEGLQCWLEESRGKTGNVILFLLPSLMHLLLFLCYSQVL